MKLSLKVGDETLALKIPTEDTGGVNVPGKKCPSCALPLRVGGSGRRIGGHDYYLSTAGCLNCGTVVGELKLTVSTIFGLEEDERVLCGRCRVY